MNYKKELKKKINADYERRVKQWMASDPAQLCRITIHIGQVKKKDEG